MFCFKYLVTLFGIGCITASHLGHDHHGYSFVSRHDGHNDHHGGHGDNGGGSDDGAYGGYSLGHHEDNSHQQHHHGVDDHQDYYHHPKYTYDYGVKDAHTGDNKKAWETRDGDVVKGGYQFEEADGTTRIVEYTSDKHHGFNAIVKNIGHAHHPQIYGHDDGHHHQQAAESYGHDDGHHHHDAYSHHHH